MDHTQASPSSSAAMRAVFAEPPGGPEVLTLRETPTPQPGAGQVRIKVAAAGVNRPDAIQREGLYPPPAGAPTSLGLEVSGVIDAVGPEVARFAKGDAVCALISGGGYADYALADEGATLPPPEGVSLRDAAGLPETAFTVWTNVFERGGLRPGETLLVHGGASGIGVMAIQMAAAWGARVIATAGSDAKCVLCEDLGAARAINYKRDDFAPILQDLGGADVILDMVGGDYTPRNLATLRQDGRLVQIAFLRGPRAEIDLSRIMRKRLTVTGSTLRARPADEKARIARAVEETVWPWIADARVRPIIDSVFALTDARAAHERLESGDHAGKILLIP